MGMTCTDLMITGILHSLNSTTDHDLCMTLMLMSKRYTCHNGVVLVQQKCI